MRLASTIFTLFILLTVRISASQHIIKPAVGDIAPEISMNDPEGQTRTLSSLRGKVVLVDFWASWCRACRVENSSLKQAYTAYKDKKFTQGNGFEIFSVSLDTDKEIWKKAIANDRLFWPNHVSELKKWDSKVVKDYNFQYLPHNVLIDQNGKIIAKGLFGKALEETLHSLLVE